MSTITKKAAVISGAVVSKRLERKGHVRVTVLCPDGSKVDLRHKQMDTIPFAMVCDLLPGDSVQMVQGDVYSLQVTASTARYAVDGCKPVALWVIAYYNEDLSEESIEAIARLNVGGSFEDMHSATVTRIK